MIDEEVEIVLREIRERVHSTPPPRDTTPDVVPSTQESRNDHELIAPDEASENLRQALARLNSYLTTTARAWDRLPPVNSSRSGFLARFELSVKSRLKSLTRWFTWEQVNFNAAVHHALRDVLEALSESQRSFETLRSQHFAELEKYHADYEELRAKSEELRTKSEELSTESEDLRVDIRTATGKLNATIWAESEARRVELEGCLAEINGLRNALVDERAQGETKLANAAAELRERVDQVQSEQRTCFKQLSLENSEAAVLVDRTRRKVDSALAELELRSKEPKKK